jgi:FkbM family methyltransferase
MLTPAVKPIRNGNSLVGEILTSKSLRRLIASAPQGRSRLGRLISRRYPTSQVFNLVGNLSDISLHLDTSDPFQSDMAYGAYQNEVIEQMLELVRPGDVVLTAGAQVGYVPLVLARVVGSRGRVITFEPDPRMIEACRRNIALNRADNIVHLVPMGLGSANEKLNMSLSSHTGQSSFAISHHHVSSASVPVRRGDEVLAELGISRIDGLVLDVEGWEMKVLAGLAKTFSAQLPRWAIIECWDVPLKAAGSSANELLKKLTSLDWTTRSVDGGEARDETDIVCTRCVS